MRNDYCIRLTYAVSIDLSAIDKNHADELARIIMQQVFKENFNRATNLEFIKSTVNLIGKENESPNQTNS